MFPRAKSGQNQFHNKVLLHSFWYHSYFLPTINVFMFQNGGDTDGDGAGGAGFGEDELLPLPENTLTRNLGLDLIVVVTKVGVIIRRISGIDPMAMGHL